MIRNDESARPRGYLARAKSIARRFMATKPNAAFRHDERGSTAMLFALSMTVVVSMVGGAVDYGRAVTARAQLQHALDAAVLAAVRSWQIDNDMTLAQSRATEFFEKNKPLGVNAALTRFAPDMGRSAIVLEATGAVRAPFLSLVRVNDLPLEVKAEALLAVGGNSELNLEISMMLDVTGSMSGQKINDLKDAAKDLIDIVVWSDQSQYTSKVAIAPFAPRVNVGAYVSQLTGLPEQRQINGSTRHLIQCVTERTGTHEFTDEAPGTGRYLRPYNAITSTSNSNYDKNWSSSGTCSDPGEQIVPLTNNRTTLHNQIDAFSAGGTTAGALGTAWAWYLLSPKWGYLWPNGSQPVAYGTQGTQKIAILMTDGEYNAWGAASANVSTTNSKALSLCTGMKNAGITVYTVGFALGGSTAAIDMLRSCATDTTKFYNAEDGAELRAAFRDIALQVASMRLSQ